MIKSNPSFDEKEVLAMNPRLFNLIGKDPVLQDGRDPLGATIKTVAEQKVQLDKFKFYHESRCDLDFVILDFAQKASNAFKTRARNTKGNSLLGYKRILHMINQNVSEFVLSQ